MTIVPLKNNILVETEIQEEQEQDGILTLGDDSPQTGTVLDSGSTVEDIKCGDTVLLPKDAEVKVSLEGKKFIIIPEENILAVIKN